MRPQYRVDEKPAVTSGDAAGQVAQQGGAVWDQPAPWVTPTDGGQVQGLWQAETIWQPRSFHQPQPEAQPEPRQQSAQAEPPAAAQDATLQVPAVPEEAATAAEAPAEAAPVEAVPVAGAVAEAATAAPTEGDSATLAASEARQPAFAPRRRGAHATPTPLLAGGVGGHAVPKRLLGAAVAAGGLLAAIGGIQGLRSHPSASVRQQAGPVVAPIEGGPVAGVGGAAATPSPSATSPTATPAATKRATKGATPGARSAALVAVPATSAGSGTSPTQQAADAGLHAAAVTANFLSAQAAVATGGNAYWAQSQLTVTSARPLSDLRVAIRVAQTGGVASTGTWTSLNGSVTVSVTDDGSGLIYVFTLNPGVVLPAGSYGFEVQYNHAAGARNTSFDAYDATAVTSDTAVTQDVRGYY